MVGQLTMENALLKKALRPLAGSPAPPRQEWRARMSQLMTEAGQDARPLLGGAAVSGESR